MAFTMHSHSGQFCPGHAKDQLEDIIKRAISLNMRLIALTEHMPRTSRRDLYPEEEEPFRQNPNYLQSMIANHHAYITEATRLRTLYAHHIKILVGFECEWIRASDAPFIRSLTPTVDLFLGSVHHVHEIPIDFDRAMYEEARKQSRGTDEALWEDYFDAQYDMLVELRPPVVAHFDLIRLYADDENKDRDLRTFPRVWKKVMRNLEYCSKQGLMIEVNSAALRKGLKKPYPGRSVCEEFLKMDGKFTLSDDSHGIDQVGLNFKRVQQYLMDVGIKQLWFFERDGNGDLADRSVQVAGLQLDAHPATAPPQAQL